MNILKSLFGSSSATLSAAEVKSRIDSKQPLWIVDVRQPEEFREGHIHGAHLIPLGELASHLDKLPKDKEILCVCRSGARSSAAAAQLTRAGITALNMRGGMIDWQRAGFPIQKGK
jgi:rhodanese-related sulfurtransferase